jgi:hypothetical protein
MHRSGTSTLAGTLRAAGVEFGAVLDKTFRLNPKGLHEAPSILFMHQNLLETNQGDWHDPPAEVVWGKLHSAVRDLFIESRAGVPVWGFKDPRTLLTLEGWFEVLPDLACAGIFRHPAEVALSLSQRNQFPLDKCFEIWRVYNERLLTFQQQRGFPVMEFVGDAARMRRSFTQMLEQLDLPAGTEALSFYEPEHKHHDRPDLDLPAPVAALYRHLQDVAL